MVLGLLFVVGACFGSFLCCQARRLRRNEKGEKKLGSRSVCLNCKAKLKWYDNIPMISWFVLKGKCRKCGKKIGAAEILSELGTGLAFFLIGLGAHLSGTRIDFASPFTYVYLVIFLILMLSLAFLAIYDGLYGELPVPFLTISIICAIIIVILKQWISFSNFSFSWQFLGDLVLSIAILGGLYLVLYLVSKGQWVGDGDWLIGIAIGLVLGKPFLALLTLFLSNLLACLVMIPVTKGKNCKVPFGPFLIFAFVIIYSFSDLFSGML